MAVKNPIISSKISNPFEGRDPDEVWEELQQNSKPLEKKKFLETLKKIKKNTK